MATMSFHHLRFRLFPLVFNAFIFGVFEVAAVPQLPPENIYPTLDRSSNTAVLIPRGNITLMNSTKLLSRLSNQWRPFQKLQHKKEPSAPSISLDTERKQKFATFSTQHIRATRTRRILSTEGAIEEEETPTRDEEPSEGTDEKESEEEHDSEDEGQAEGGQDSDEIEDFDEEETEEEHVDKEEQRSMESERIASAVRTATDGQPNKISAHARSKNVLSREIDKGAMVGGSKDKSKFRGVPGGIVDGTNITHISYMLYKIVKKYNIKTIVDIPCRNNVHWFPKLLVLLDYEVMGFNYICVDENADMDEELHAHFADSGTAEFLSIPPTLSEELPKSDLVFSYDGPQQWGVRKTWGFFTGLRKVRPKYIIVTNNPGQMNNDKQHTLNLRKQPFHFSQAMRVFSNIHTSGNPKQLVFYETNNVREGF